MITHIEAVLLGKIVALTDKGDLSAIGKVAMPGAHMAGPQGFIGDEQADRSAHGGVDKAIHHYPRDHYEKWQQQLGPHPLLEYAGAFGENISTYGWLEGDVCIGDRFRLGSALVEVSQGRQPCWKQGHRLGTPKLVAMMVQTRMCGWYYRVLEQGAVAAGDDVTLVERPLPEWTVARVIGLLLGGAGKQDPAAVRFLADMSVLAAPWRAKAASLIA
jgi:MOSC domain-containing protein YiiM